MQTQNYVVDSNGNFRFTKTGLKSQAPLLAKAGIDAQGIKTYDHYVQARQAASPYFLEYLKEEADKMLKGKPQSTEWLAIRSIAYGTAEDQIKWLNKLKLKKSFTIV